MGECGRVWESVGEFGSVWESVGEWSLIVSRQSLVVSCIVSIVCVLCVRKHAICIRYTVFPFLLEDASVLCYIFICVTFMFNSRNECDSGFLERFRFMLFLVGIVKFMYLFLHICNLTCIHVVYVFVFVYMSLSGKLR